MNIATIAALALCLIGCVTAEQAAERQAASATNAAEWDAWGKAAREALDRNCREWSDFRPGTSEYYRCREEQVKLISL
jgi:hypothetical protein